ncbi:MAG TPA: uroporphyrinogen-III synthase [Azoarcus taiwanensis]|nr:uroporphyrinogen-III synthase [Azoarcus taiwanensis]
MSLSGRHVVVTRPLEQAGAMCDALRARGAEPVLFPVLAIAPAADAAGLEAACRDLQDFDLAFFVSPNAVRLALDAILARRGWPEGVAVATVGAGSARALADYGFDHVIAPESGFDTEAVIALPAFSPEAVRGKRVVIFRGDGGRELLGQYLRANGAEVVHVTAYRRYCPDADPAVLTDLAALGCLDAITLTSSEGVRNFADLLGPQGLDCLSRVPVFVPHPRIAGFAREAGFRQVIETGAGDAGLMLALEAFFGGK